ncbi:MAG: hypothetical protein B7Y88_15720 [Sphingomonadales bacterium 32-64-17]|nr:MAG: hypothetical protein B7Y88_15720 [Sphingomonadales bacterium 32-64-17]
MLESAVSPQPAPPAWEGALPHAAVLPKPSEARPRILIVDGDSEYRTSTGHFLADHGFLVLEAENAGAARDLLSQYTIDIVVLDVNISGEDGLAITRALSVHQDVCVIIVSELASEIDRIVGLEAGADDYLPKPASARELLARIRAVRRRLSKSAKLEQATSICYLFSGWSLDIDRRQLRDQLGTITSLSDGEFTLLRAFVERPQRVLTRDQLLEYARGANCDAYDRAIDTQISRLRRKLGMTGNNDLIRTVRNEGYMFVAKVVQR